MEKLQEIEKLEVPEMSEAVNAYYTITAESEFIELQRQNERALHDEASAIGNAVRKTEKRVNESWQKVVDEKDVTLAEKDATLAEKDALISELQRKLDAK